MKKQDYEYIGTTKNSEYDMSMMQVSEFLGEAAYNPIDNHVTVLETRLREANDRTRFQKTKFDKIAATVSLINTLEESAAAFPETPHSEQIRLRELKSELNKLVGL